MHYKAYCNYKALPEEHRKLNCAKLIHKSGKKLPVMVYTKDKKLFSQNHIWAVPPKTKLSKLINKLMNQVQFGNIN